MKITYLGQFKTEKHTIEKDVKETLERMGHEVVAIDDTEFNPEEVAKIANSTDLFLFRRGGVLTTDIVSFQETLGRLQFLLSLVKVKKVFWFFDKVMGFGHQWMYSIEPMVDCGFLNDETFLRRHHADKLFPLHLGFNNSGYVGKFNSDYACDVAFDGPIYGTRDVFIKMMKDVFGDRFKVFNLEDNNKFADLCASAKIIVSPRFPYDDFFWSEKVYKTLGNGGFLMFPRFEGLKEEGLEDGYQFAGYNVYGEMVEIIKWWLQNGDRQKEGLKVIPQQGKDTVLKNFTYEKRLEVLLNTIFPNVKK